jgi:hypothetical protein
MKTQPCRNAACRKPFSRYRGSKAAYCSASCRHDADLARRRARYASRRIPVFHCHDCGADFTVKDTWHAEYCDRDNAYQVTEPRNPCAECGAPIVPVEGYVSDGHFCSEDCWWSWCSQSFPGVAREDVPFLPEYALLNSLTGVLPSADDVELFGTLDNPLTGWRPVSLRQYEEQASEELNPPVQGVQVSPVLRERMRVSTGHKVTTMRGSR